MAETVPNIAKSELLSLLMKNAYGVGLTSEEIKRAKQLILTAVPTTENCWLCEMYKREDEEEEVINKAIYDTGLCKDHNYYALVTRK